MELSEKSGDYHSVAMMMMINLGDTYRKARNFDKAEFYLNEGLNRVVKIGDKYWEAISYRSIGTLINNKGDNTKAKEFMFKAQKLFLSIGANEEAEKTLLAIKKLEGMR